MLFITQIAEWILAIFIAICSLFVWSGDKYTTYCGGAHAHHETSQHGSVFRHPVPLIKEYKDITRRAAYERHAAQDSINVHNGQLKLFLTELQFLTLCLRTHDAPATVVYAGSAPSNKMSYLANLFPNVKFVLVDPHEHYIMFPTKTPDTNDISLDEMDDNTNNTTDSSATHDIIAPKHDKNTSGHLDMYADEYSRQVLFFQAAPLVPREKTPPGMKARKRAHETPPLVPLYKPSKSLRDTLIAQNMPQANASANASANVPSVDQILTPVMSPRLEHAINGEIPDNLAEVINKTSYRFYIIENMFTNELADKLAALKGPVYFVSDIRTSTGDMPTDYDICLNSAMMYNWLARLKPTRFMLKFRCPWVPTAQSIERFAETVSDFGNTVFNDCPIDFRGNFAQGKFVYIRPEHIFVQAFAGATSTETRLVSSTLDTVEYDMLEYEEKFMWFNTVHRQRNPIKDAPDNTGPPIKCYNRRQDCALAVQIFTDYLEKYNGGAYMTEGSVYTPQTAIEMLRELLGMIGRTMCKSKEYHEFAAD